MKKLFYRLSRSRLFAKLFSLLACMALGSLFTQQAVAQDFEFGWEPFPPSSWDGGWDANLNCGALDGGTTTLSRGANSDSVVQEGKVSCTFTDPANNNFSVTATCLLSVQFPDLSETCDNGTLTVAGFCPYKKGNNLVGSNGTGTIDCRGRNPDGSINLGLNPDFCTYAGNDPDGNATSDCQWNLGFGQINGSNLVPLTQSQCETAFPASTEPSLALMQVFKFTQVYDTAACTGQFKSLGAVQERFCHSDTWDGGQLAACQFVQGGAKSTGDAVVASVLTADTEYSPTTINSDCSGNKDNGDVALTVLGNNRDKNTNPIDVQTIALNTITVNGFSAKAETCSFPNPNTLTCKVPSCIGGDSVVGDTIIPNTKTATLQMEAFMKDGTHVVGDLEIRKVSP